MSVSPVAAVFLIPVIAWLCPPIATICDDYLAEAVEIMCDRYQVPEHVAAVSIIAMVSSAPELMIMMQSAVTDHSKVGLSTQLGSALIAFGMIPSICTWHTPFLHVHMAPLIRDCVAFVLGLGALTGMVYRRKGVTRLQVADGFVLVLLYSLYLVFVLVSHYAGWMGKRISYTEIEGEESNSEVTQQADKPIADVENPLQGYQKKLDAYKQQEEKKDPMKQCTLQKDEDPPQGCRGHMMLAAKNSHRVLAVPLEWLFAHTIPDCTKEGNENYSPVTSVLALLYLGVLSFCLLQLATLVVGAWKIDETFAGVALLCFVAQIPDAYAAMALVKKGMHDAAVLHALSSQVLNLTVGIGLPCLVYNLANQRPLAMQDNFCILIITCLGTTVGAFLLLFFLPLCIQCSCGASDERVHTGGIGLNKRTGLLLLGIYGVVHLFLGVSIATNWDPFPETTQTEDL